MKTLSAVSTLLAVPASKLAALALSMATLPAAVIVEKLMPVPAETLVTVPPAAITSQLKPLPESLVSACEPSLAHEGTDAAAGTALLPEKLPYTLEVAMAASCASVAL